MLPSWSRSFAGLVVVDDRLVKDGKVRNVEMLIDVMLIYLHELSKRLLIHDIDGEQELSYPFAEHPAHSINR